MLFINKSFSLLPLIFKSWFTFCYYVHNYQTVSSTTNEMFKRSPILHSQINLIKFVEWNKFDKVYSEIWNIIARSNFFKIWPFLVHQISRMKNIKSNFQSLQRRKIEVNKTTNESTWNIFVARFNFGVLASLIFIIYFVISSFTKANNSSKHSGVLYNFIPFLLF